MTPPHEDDAAAGAMTRRTPYALPWVGVDDLSPAQVAAMHSLDDARRAGSITDVDFYEIEAVIRGGHVAGARKRLTEAKRRNGAAMVARDLVVRLRWMAEHDHAALVEVLRTIDQNALRIALRLAGPDSATPIEPGPAHSAPAAGHV